MVELFDHVIVYDNFKLFKVYQIARGMSNLALYCYKKVIVMAVPVRVGTFAKHLIVFLCAPFLTIHSMSGIKMLFARNIYHHNICGCKYTKQKQGICFILACKK